MTMRNFASALIVAMASASSIAALPLAPARAEEPPVFRVELKDGTIAPMRIEVPANRDIKLEVVNSGTTPVEFESKELRKEKVLAPGTTSSIVIRALKPGEYQFFDEFHPDAGNAVLVAK
jgi:heme/copper-type cytochrome/quinol oxidase subunit 2